MARYLLFVSLLLINIFAAAQIVNIETRRLQSDTTGWKGSLGANFSLIKNTQQIVSINTNAHLQYKAPKDLYLLLANYTLLRRNNQSLAQNMFYHLRYNRKLNDWVRWEAFTQWQQNAVTNIDLRLLAGTGPRFKLVDNEKLKLYAATAAMYEYEKEKTDPLKQHRDLRSSNYVSFTYVPRPSIEIISTTFYQPLYRHIKDFRLLNQISVHYKWSKHFSITTSWDYLYDAFPATGTPLINYTFTNGFAYAF